MHLRQQVLQNKNQRSQKRNCNVCLSGIRCCRTKIKESKKKLKRPNLLRLSNFVFLIISQSVPTFLTYLNTADRRSTSICNLGTNCKYNNCKFISERCLQKCLLTRRLMAKNLPPKPSIGTI